MRKLKILHLSNTDINYDARIVREMSAVAKWSEEIILRGFGVRIVEGSLKSALSESLTVETIQLYFKKNRYLPSVVSNCLSLLEFMLKMTRRTRTFKPDIIHAHDVFALPFCVMAKIFIGCKLIYDAHELESDRNGLHPLLAKPTFIIEKMLWRYVDHFITVSYSIDAWYLEKMGAKPTSVILNSPIHAEINPEDEGFGKDYLRKKFDISPARKIFLVVGNFAPGRGIEDMLKIFSEISAADIVFLGFGGLAGLIEKASSSFSNIHFHPPVSHEKVLSVAQSADVGLCIIKNVSLSDYFCLPNKLFEYCLAGLPVIASDFPDIKMMVNRYNLGLCCSPDEGSMKEAIENCIANDNVFELNRSDLRDLEWATQEERLISIYECLREDIVRADEK